MVASKNVLESSPLYDSIVICSAAGQTGSEGQIPGWFQSFQAFGQRQEHSLFKTRTEAMAGLAYCNQQVSDRADFAFHAFSIGISFWGPPIQDMTEDDTPGIADDVWAANSFWTADLPNASAIEFRVGVDVKLCEKCLGIPPGYGPSGDGLAVGVDSVANAHKLYAGPMMFQNTSQGVPFLTNRFDFIDPVDIPRNATIEAKLLLSQWARDALAVIMGPTLMYVPTTPDATNDFFPSRYGVTASLYGIREVQQRGQLSAR